MQNYLRILMFLFNGLLHSFDENFVVRLENVVKCSLGVSLS